MKTKFYPLSISRFYKVRTVLCLLSLGIIMSSCTKDDDEVDTDSNSNNFSTQSSQDNDKNDREWESISSIIQDAIEHQADSASLRTARGSATSCATVTFDTANDSIIVDFGTSGCDDFDGRTRTGKIKVHYTGAYGETGSVITTVPENYVVNDIKVEGKHVVTNDGPNTDGDDEFTVVVTDGKLTYKDGDITTWASTRKRIWKEGDATPLNIYDDLYAISGTASGVNRDGLAYTMSVKDSDPLLYDFSCWPTYQIPKDGTLTISPEGLEDRVVDYGEGGGDCDYTIRITVGFFSIPITLN